MYRGLLPWESDGIVFYMSGRPSDAHIYICVYIYVFYVSGRLPGARALRALTRWVGPLKKDLTRVGVGSQACRGLEGWRLGCLMAWRGLEGWRLGCLMACRGLEAWWLGGLEARRRFLHARALRARRTISICWPL